MTGLISRFGFLRKKKGNKKNLADERRLFESVMSERQGRIDTVYQLIQEPGCPTALASLKDGVTQQLDAIYQDAENDSYPAAIGKIPQLDTALDSAVPAITTFFGNKDKYARQAPSVLSRAAAILATESTMSPALVQKAALLKTARDALLRKATVEFDYTSAMDNQLPALELAMTPDLVKHAADKKNFEKNFAAAEQYFTPLLAMVDTEITQELKDSKAQMKTVRDEVVRLRDLNDFDGANTQLMTVAAPGSLRLTVADSERLEFLANKKEFGRQFATFRMRAEEVLQYAEHRLSTALTQKIRVVENAMATVKHRQSLFDYPGAIEAINAQNDRVFEAMQAVRKHDQDMRNYYAQLKQLRPQIADVESLGSASEPVAVQTAIADCVSAKNEVLTAQNKRDFAEALRKLPAYRSALDRVITQRIASIQTEIDDADAPGKVKDVVGKMKDAELRSLPPATQVKLLKQLRLEANGSEHTLSDDEAKARCRIYLNTKMDEKFVQKDEETRKKLADALLNDKKFQEGKDKWGEWSRTATPVNLTAATQANPVVLTTGADHAFVVGDKVEVSGVGGMTELNGKTFEVHQVAARTITLKKVDSTGYTAYTSGGSIKLSAAQVTKAIEKQQELLKHALKKQCEVMGHPVPEINFESTRQCEAAGCPEKGENQPINGTDDLPGSITYERGQPVDPTCNYCPNDDYQKFGIDLGGCSNGKDDVPVKCSITINMVKEANFSDFRETFDSVMHENAHAYQMHLVYDKLGGKQKGQKPFDKPAFDVTDPEYIQAELFYENEFGYVSGSLEDDLGMPNTYKKQPLEAHAWTFGPDMSNNILGPAAIKKEVKPLKIIGATQADPVVLTLGRRHEFETGDRVYIRQVGGMTELNGKKYDVVKVSDNQISLNETSGGSLDGSTFTAFTSGGIVTPHKKKEQRDSDLT